MATTPTTTVRIGAAAAATVAAVALAVYPVASASGSIAAPLTVALLAMITLTVGLASQRPVAVGAALALLALERALQPGHTHPSPGATALYAAGLIVTAELAFWSLTSHLLTPTRQRLVRKVTTTVIAAFGAATIAALVAEGAHTSVSGAWLEPFGIVAAIAATLLLTLLARNTDPTDR
jgi:hypothetical protein